MSPGPQRLWLLGPGATALAARLAHDARWPLCPHAAWPLTPAETGPDFVAAWGGLTAQAQAESVLVLLAGDAAAAPCHQETSLRQVLDALPVAFQIVFAPQGHHDEGLHRWLGWTPRPRHRGRLSALCEKCSDPDCEHRLFQDLVAQRDARAH